MELLLLLLPVAAASGWFAAKRSERKIHKSEPMDYVRNPAYFRGLNYLLNEQPDKAIDVFVQMLEVDSETVETHLALGGLFRRRGEVDRAIRIHQNLIARPSLSRSQRARALLELGQDYMRAGLFDRAESLFNELIEINQFQKQALQNLRVIYQQEKDWLKCLRVSTRLESLSNEPNGVEQAHYYCELAELARGAKDFSAMARYLNRAHHIHRGCVRATLLQGEMEVMRRNYKAAIRVYKRVEQQDPDYLSEMLPGLIDCYRKLGDRKGLAHYLRQLFERQKSLAPMLALADVLREEDEDVVAFVTDYLRQYPSLLGVDRLVLLNLEQADEPIKGTLAFLRSQVGRLLEKQVGYQCGQCGFHGKSMHWQCPGCKSWGSIKLRTV